MFSTILWATDGSREADAALDTSLQLLGDNGRIVAYHCDQRFIGSRIGGSPVLPDEDDRRRHIHATVADLNDQGYDVELLVESTTRDPAWEIPRAADEVGADAIVCATRALHGLTGFLNGSVAAGVLRTATVPVLVVPPTVGACRPEATPV